MQVLTFWRRHWWQRTEELPAIPSDEPTVLVDPSLCVERPVRRFARGTVPPASCVGAYCALEPAETEGISGDE
jgi:hypothetical protein